MKNISLKIIAGKYKGITIHSYSEETKETSHMVRGAVFNMIHPIAGIGLDLFAGSGAYGFEALSRGLSQVYLNDNHPLAYKALRDNQTKLKTGAILFNQDYSMCILELKRLSMTFDYIFLDPPYEMAINPIIEQCVPILKDKGIMVAETNKTTTIDTPLVNVLKTKTHGIKTIHIMKKAE